MSKNNLNFQGTISRNYAKKQILKFSLSYFALFAAMISMFGFATFIGALRLEMYLMVIFYIVLIPYMIILVFVIWFEFKYVKMFSFEVLENNLIIRHGVFNWVKATIPYSRIQNINITNGVFDRIYKTFTVKVETAGFSAAASGRRSGLAKPEGYIPGLKEPNIIENKIKEHLKRHSAIPSGL